MEPETSLLFTCTRQDFSSNDRATVKHLCRGGINWDTVWKISRNHGVAPLVYKNLRSMAISDLGMPVGINNLFNSHLFENISRRKNSQQELKICLSQFNNRDVDVMLLKGAALNIHVYESPWLTFSEDTDLLFRQKRAHLIQDDLEALISLMEGFNHSDIQNREHIEYDFYEHHDVNMNGVLPVDFDSIWDQARQIRFLDHIVYVMTPEDSLIAACVGSCRKRYLRLKSLLDIHEITIKLKTLNWDLIIRKANDYGCGNILYTALVTADLTLGINLPECVLDKLQVSQTRKRIVRTLTQRLCRENTLATLAPDEGIKIFGRRSNPALLLTYATYTPEQFSRKTGEIIRSWWRKRIAQVGV